jgi:acyl-CoA synthetase (AMP-forming)/AMP-acid ligase II
VHSCDEYNFAGRLVRRLKEDSCLVDAATGQRVSGQQLPSFIAGFAAGFLSAGLRPGDRVLIACGLDPASTIAYLGAMYAGLVPVPIERRLLSSCGGSILAKARAQGVWTEGGDCLNADVQQIAALMPTSGSTGIPRLVMVSHGNLIANTEAIIRSQHLGVDEKAMLIMPISYCFGASVMHTHLYQGGGIVFDSRFMFPDKVLNAINQYGCTSFAGVPFVYNMLVRRSNLKSLPLRALRRFMQAGGALAPEIIRQICNIVPTAEFFVMYGQTEATARISSFPASRQSHKLGSAGRLLDNLEIRIVDHNAPELTAHAIGEIQVRGPSICSGYFDDPASTAEKFSDGWLKTGDIATFDEEGYLWIKGRSSDFLKIRGFRVSIGEVEAKITAIPGVYECAAAAVPDPETGEALALFIVPDHDLTERAKQDFSETVKRALPPHWTCSSLTVISELPRTTSGKIARPHLQTMACTI